MDRLRSTLVRQDGVVSQDQALRLGLQHHDLRRLVRRRELTPLFPRVYVEHTGEPTWLQRAWGAVSGAWPAALAGESALRAADGPGRPSIDQRPIEVAIDRSRRVTSPPGIVVRRTHGLDERVLWNLGPPRMSYHEAALDVALAAPDDFRALAVVASAVQSQHTTALRMQAALARRRRAARRGFLTGLLDDVAQGTCSVLEHGYLTRVERPHHLPTLMRQVREVTASGVVYRDGALPEVIVELDGRLFHNTAEQRDSDFERDLDAAVEGRGTVRLTYGQVFERPCSTAAKLSRLFVRLGVPAGRPCSPECVVAG
ncbi:MAG: hypothetical protein LT071_13600 [Nocardioides sp.]|nr:hypothetical protein [Nocardioides sp.]